MTLMKRTTIALLLTVSMLFAFFAPVKAEAANPYEFKTITAGSWITTSWNNEGGTWHNTYYVIKVTAPGELRFVLTGDDKNTNPSVYIYDLKKDIIDGKATGAYVNNSSSLKAISVDKGTYYLKVSGKCRVVYVKANNKVNYSMSTALSLNASTGVRVVQTPFYNYSRWYKIKTTSKKKIRYYANTVEHASKIEMFNSRGKKLKTVKYGAGYSYCTEAAQAAGVYYLRVPSYYMYETDYFMPGEIYSFKWWQ